MHGTALRVNELTATSLDLEMFLQAMKKAVLRWYAEHRQDETVIRNADRLISWRPNGFPPFADMPVIASGVEYPRGNAWAAKGFYNG